MHQNIHISVITICKNEEATIERTIRSVGRQSFPHIEHVIIDGQSTDGTLDVIKRYEQCRLISEPDAGIYDAMNKGVQAAEGDFLLFINAGDYLIHDRVLEKCVSLISTAPETIDIFFGNIFFYNAIDGSGWMWRPARRSRLSMFMGCLPHPATFFSRHSFEKNGPFDTSFQIAGDYEWFVRGMEKKHLSFQHIDTLVSLFNQDGGVSTRPEMHELHEREKQKIYHMHYSALDRKRFRVGVFFKKNFKF